MKLLSRIFDRISQVKIKSITDSLFKYGLTTLALGIVSAIFTDKDWVTITVFSFSALFIVSGLIAYFYFAFKNPEYLRSENYQLKVYELELLGDNDSFKNEENQSITKSKNKKNKPLPFKNKSK